MAVKHAQWGRAILHNGRRQYAQAQAAGTEAMLHGADFGTHLFIPELIEAAVRDGCPEIAATALERLTRTTEPSGTDWAVGVQRRSEALLTDGADAEDLYREAIERLGRTSLRPELARAHLLYGEWLRRESRRVDARAQLRIAHELFTAIGALAFVERAGHELLATGETVRKRTPGRFDELTPQEANITRLAADGYTNVEIGAQLFISARTVEWHLKKVFTKIGVTSRRELRAVAPRHVALVGGGGPSGG
jgi:DNA-binding CsgD family transcriptional regulator